jgi:hypothetical protein
MRRILREVLFVRDLREPTVASACSLFLRRKHETESGFKAGVSEEILVGLVKLQLSKVGGRSTTCYDNGQITRTAGRTRKHALSQIDIAVQKSVLFALSSSALRYEYAFFISTTGRLTVPLERSLNKIDDNATVDGIGFGNP